MNQSAVERLDASRAQLRATLLSPSASMESSMLKQALEFATDTIEPLIKPLAEKNPVLLVVGAGLIGGCVVALKPWRWPVASMFAALLPVLGPALLPGLLQKGLLDALMALLTHKMQPPNH